MEYEPRQMRKKTVFLISALILLFGLSALPFQGKTVYEDECRLKSAFFEKLTRYIRWPEQSGMSDRTTPFVIGILGESPLEPCLKELYSQKTILRKKVEIRSIETLRGIYGCHIVFIPSSMEKILETVIEVTENEPILTIADTSGFGEQGVLINFYAAEKKLRFEINEPAFRRASLTPDSRLLEIARIVKTRGGGR